MLKLLILLLQVFINLLADIFVIFPNSEVIIKRGKQNMQQLLISNLEIKKTKDYYIFKKLPGNRELGKVNMKNIERSILENNLLNVNPIIVNPDFSIVDGQHRLAIAEKHNLYIYYIVSPEDLKLNDVQHLNRASKKWDTYDFISSHKGNPSYDFMLSLISEKRTASAIAYISLHAVGLNNKSRLAINTHLYTGKIELSDDNKKYMLNVVDTLQYLQDILIASDNTFVYSHFFIDSLCTLMKYKNFNIDTFKHKVLLQKMKLTKCADRKQYLDLLKKIYNYKLHADRIE